MEKERPMKDFSLKFSQLSAANQRYIIGIQQALIFAQTSDTKVDDYSEKENGEAHETGTV